MLLFIYGYYWDDALIVGSAPPVHQAKEQLFINIIFSLALPHAHTTYTHTIRNNNGAIPNEPLCSSLWFHPVSERTAFESVYRSFCTEHFAL